MRTRGQSVFEYAVCVAVIAAMLLGMAVYVKRGLCGRWRQVGDVFGYGRQFEPDKTVVSSQ